MLAVFFITISQLFSFALGIFWGGVPAVVKGQCWVVAAYVSSGFILAVFFITISHCPWRDFISMSVGLGRRRVVAAYVSAGLMLAKFFITISHCPWRDFISWSFGDKETKQRKRLPTICIKCPQRADRCFWFPRRTVLAKPRTLETLLLANPYIPTLRHQCSRARSMAHGLVRPLAYLRLVDCVFRATF